MIQGSTVIRTGNSHALLRQKEHLRTSLKNNQCLYTSYLPYLWMVQKVAALSNIQKYQSCKSLQLFSLPLTKYFVNLFTTENGV